MDSLCWIVESVADTVADTAAAAAAAPIAVAVAHNQSSYYLVPLRLVPDSTVAAAALRFPAHNTEIKQLTSMAIHENVEFLSEFHFQNDKFFQIMAVKCQILIQEC